MIMWLEFVFSEAMVIVQLEAFENSILKLTFIALFVLLSVAVMYYAYLGQITDSMDPLINQWRNTLLTFNRKVEKDKIEETVKELGLDSSFFKYQCDICESPVGSQSKHCGTCNKCICEFDHHCEWLNNCIGHLNYHIFIKFISVYTVHIVVMIVFEVVFLKSTNPTRENIMQFAYGLIPFFVTKLLILLNLDCQHIYYSFYGIGTYDYILEEREREELQIKLEAGEISKETYA